MLAVPLAEEDVLSLFGEELSLAASKGPEVMSSPARRRPSRRSSCSSRNVA